MAKVIAIFDTDITPTLLAQDYQAIYELGKVTPVKSPVANTQAIQFDFTTIDDLVKFAKGLYQDFDLCIEFEGEDAYIGKPK